jgi:hypothetical protein
MQDLVLGIVDVIGEEAMGERTITVRADHPKPLIIVLPEWRISEFDFGGVPVPNPWFDPERIETEDDDILNNSKTP